MKLSLSVRIAEGFLSKEVPMLPLEEVADIAIASGYEAICMRASQVGVHSPSEDIANAHQLLESRRLAVSMVTGDFATVYNNQSGPQSLRCIGPFLKLAKSLDASLLRVAIQTDADIEWAQSAADEAAEVGITLVHQCHTLSLFETVESIRKTLMRINRPNFGLIYEPANLQICDQDYGLATIETLAPWIKNVYLQNQRLQSAGRVVLDTWCRGPVAFDIIPIHQPGTLDFESILLSLSRIGYQGYVTVHQSATDGETPSQSARRTADFLRKIIA